MVSVKIIHAEILNFVLDFHFMLLWLGVQNCELIIMIINNEMNIALVNPTDGS